MCSNIKIKNQPAFSFIPKNGLNTPLPPGITLYLIQEKLANQVTCNLKYIIHVVLF